jgi:hypothetical protein
MKRHLAAVLSVLAVVAGVGWKLGRHPETSVRLRDISLIERSEHSHPGHSKLLAAIRIRLSPSDFGCELREPAQEVPQISLAGE